MRRSWVRNVFGILERCHFDLVGETPILSVTAQAIVRLPLSLLRDPEKGVGVGGGRPPHQPLFPCVGTQCLSSYYYQRNDSSDEGMM